MVDNRAYFSAIAMARKEIADGYALSYLTGYDPKVGRYIEVMTDQGWNPDRFWEEFPMSPLGQVI